VKNLSKELGSWKCVKDELISFLEKKEDSHNLIEIHLRDGDLVSASSIAARYISNTFDVERVAKACETATEQQNTITKLSSGSTFLLAKQKSLDII
jgi:hypothetical protein